MASRKITDIDILRACLDLPCRDQVPTTTRLADHMGVSVSGLHRRLHVLAVDGYLESRLSGEGSMSWHLKPSSLDLCGVLREGTVEMFWQVSDTGLFLTPVAK